MLVPSRYDFSLPVDVENNALARLQQVVDRPARGAVTVAEYLRVFDKLAVRGHGLELLRAHEIVVHAVGLARARRTRGVRYRKREIAHALHEFVRQAGLAGAGSGGEDEKFGHN